jgi:hypothetical protein
MTTVTKKTAYTLFLLQYILLIIVFLAVGCKKTTVDSPPIPNRVPKPDGTLVYSTAILDSVSPINKTSSWHNTNKSFSSLFNMQFSLYSGFELTDAQHFMFTQI